MILNETLFNEGMYNGGFSLAETYSLDLIVFDGLSLNDLVNSVCTGLDDSMPAREVEDVKIPRADGTYFIQAYASEKPISARGYFKAETKEEMEAYLDTVRKVLWRKERKLDITRTPTRVRRYIATLDNPQSIFSDREGTDITKVPWQVTFKARNPAFGKDREYTSITESFSISPRNMTAENFGTEKADPIITVIFSAASSVSALEVLNNANGLKIKVTTALVAGDIIEFNAEAKTVKKNGVEIDFTGTFPLMETGTNVFSFTTTGTSFAVTATISHKNTYL